MTDNRGQKAENWEQQKAKELLEELDEIKTGGSPKISSWIIKARTLLTFAAILRLRR